MSLTSTLAAVAALAAGTAGAITAYQVAAPEPSAQGSSLVSSTDRESRDGKPRFAPCERPAKLQDGTCVTTLTKNVPAPGLPGRDDSQTPGAAADDNARRDAADDDLVVVEDHDDGDDDWDDGSHTNTNTGSGFGAGDTGTHGGTRAGTSTGTGRG